VIPWDRPSHVFRLLNLKNQVYFFASFSLLSIRFCFRFLLFRIEAKQAKSCIFSLQAKRNFHFDFFLSIFVSEAKTRAHRTAGQTQLFVCFEGGGLGENKERFPAPEWERKKKK
jgi:hypothetical protein